MNTYLFVPAGSLRAGDVLVNRVDERQTWLVSANPVRVEEPKRPAMVRFTALGTCDTPSNWVLAHDHPCRVLDLEPCGDCRATGTRQLAGGTVNGKFVGVSGKCYRCAGNGSQSRADRARNWHYDNRVMRVRW